MKPDRSKNDLIVLGLVGVLGIVALGIVAAVLWEREVPEAMSSLAVGIVGGILGYVTAGRSKSQEPPEGQPEGDVPPLMVSDPIPDDAAAGLDDDYSGDDDDEMEWLPENDDDSRS